MIGRRTKALRLWASLPALLLALASIYLIWAHRPPSSPLDIDLGELLVLHDSDQSFGFAEHQRICWYAIDEGPAREAVTRSDPSMSIGALDEPVGRVVFEAVRHRWPIKHRWLLCFELGSAVGAISYFVSEADGVYRLENYDRWLDWRLTR